jgi:hypothetical protein
MHLLLFRQITVELLGEVVNMISSLPPRNKTLLRTLSQMLNRWGDELSHHSRL